VPDFSGTSAPSHEEIAHLDALFGRRQFASLESAATSLSARYPNSGIVWKLLGMSLQMQGKDSLPAFEKAARFLPQDAEAHVNFAAALRAAGDYQRAVDINQRALAISPSLAQAHNNLGVALQDLHHINDAISCYRRAIELMPNFAEAHSNLGSALKEIEQFDAAVASYQRALEINPNHAKVLSNLGAIKQSLGDVVSATENYRRALELDPSCIEAMLGICQLCVECGDLESANNLLHTLLGISPNNLDARYLQTQINRATPNDSNMSALIDIEDSFRHSKTPIPFKQSALLHFSLGKCFDDIGEYDKAFSHFAQGCKLKRSTINHDALQISRHFDEIIRIFNQQTITQLRNSACLSELPIFILGMPRSGTTLTEQIISSHPEVYGAGELPDLLDVVHHDASDNRMTYPHNIVSGTTPETIAAWAREYVSRLQHRAPMAKRITDKMPSNFLALGLIHALLPNAKIIHVNRNPVDTCVSCFTQLFTTGQYYSYDLTELGQYYADYTRLMNHWRNVLPPNAFLDVRYEDIVANPEIEARRLIQFCNLDWDVACLNFYRSERSVQTASRIQVRQPIYNTSVARWRRYGSALDPLLNSLGKLAAPQ
jgi:tetratricopeptide (TPR) repeat protein